MSPMVPMVPLLHTLHFYNYFSHLSTVTFLSLLMVKNIHYFLCFANSLETLVDNFQVLIVSMLGLGITETISASCLAMNLIRFMETLGMEVIETMSVLTNH